MLVRPLCRATAPSCATGTRPRTWTTPPPWRCGCGGTTAAAQGCRSWRVVGLEVLDRDTLHARGTGTVARPLVAAGVSAALRRRTSRTDVEASGARAALRSTP